MDFLNAPRIFIFILIGFISSCNNINQNKSKDITKRQYVQQTNPVDVIVLERGIFRKEMVNNGKLTAIRKCDLQFKVSEQLDRLIYRNGDFVEKGQVIGELNSFSYKQQSSSAEIKLKSAELELLNVLIGQGYREIDTTKIPAHIYEMAIIRSGYKEALQSMETAKYNLEATKLVAPFSGKLANIEQKQFEQVTTGKPFCTLIDDSEFEVEFNVVENEIGEIDLGGEVLIKPFNSDSKMYKGRLTEINPVIDENGLIKVKALIKNNGELIDGMNVKVFIEKEIPGQLVVPKSAVLLRDNQEVLFKCVHDSVAFWTYVETIAENSTSYSVIAHPNKGGSLESGDTIIVSGNLNLAHESGVVVE